MRTKKAGEIALRLTEGLLRTTTDVILFTLFLTFASAGKSKTSIGGHQMFDEAERALKDFNYEAIKRSLIQLKHQGMVTYKRKYLQETLAITVEGKKRLEEILPRYRKKRTWDNRMYLITYDVPQTRKYNREILRSFLKRLGAAMLQESVWITPYNPRETLRSFLEERGLSEVVIISDLGKDAIIGDIALHTLIRTLYHLDSLNKRYKKFFESHEEQKTSNPLGAAEYLGILRDDPQLPFPLLPKNWLGDEAYRLALKLYPSLHL